MFITNNLKKAEEFFDEKNLKVKDYGAACHYLDKAIKSDDFKMRHKALLLMGKLKQVKGYFKEAVENYFAAILDIDKKYSARKSCYLDTKTDYNYHQ